MKLKVLEKRGNRLRLLVEEAPLAFVNSIRRTCILDVPVMAVDEVLFLENDTVLYDEIIAHRLGLIPLTSEEALEKYGPPEECERCTESSEAEICRRCFASLYLEVEGEDKPRIIYSGDLESSDPIIKPVYDNMPIAYVGPGQKLSFEARARLGRGREHAKWMPVSVAAHKYLPILNYDLTKGDKEAVENCLACISGASKKIAEVISENKKGRYEILEDLNTSLYYYCSRGPCKGLLDIEYDPSTLILTIETTGALSPEKVLIEAAEILRRKSLKMLELLDKTSLEEG